VPRFKYLTRAQPPFPPQTWGLIPPVASWAIPTDIPPPPFLWLEEVHRTRPPDLPPLLTRPPPKPSGQAVGFFLPDHFLTTMILFLLPFIARMIPPNFFLFPIPTPSSVSPHTKTGPFLFFLVQSFFPLRQPVFYHSFPNAVSTGKLPHFYNFRFPLHTQNGTSTKGTFF